MQSVDPRPSAAAPDFNHLPVISLLLICPGQSSPSQLFCSFIFSARTATCRFLCYDTLSILYITLLRVFLVLLPRIAVVPHVNSPKSVTEVIQPIATLHRHYSVVPSINFDPLSEASVARPEDPHCLFGLVLESWKLGKCICRVRPTTSRESKFLFGALDPSRQARHRSYQLQDAKIKISKGLLGSRQTSNSLLLFSSDIRLKGSTFGMGLR
jgi:hypothetical protein